MRGCVKGKGEAARDHVACRSDTVCLRGGKLDVQYQQGTYVFLAVLTFIPKDQYTRQKSSPSFVSAAEYTESDLSAGASFYPKRQLDRADPLNGVPTSQKNR